MLDLEKYHYEKQLEDFSSLSLYDLLQCYTDYIDPDYDHLDLDCILARKSAKEAVLFMDKYKLTPHAEMYWKTISGSYKCGTVVDYVEDLWSDDLFHELLDEVSLDIINSYLEDETIEEYEE